MTAGNYQRKQNPILMPRWLHSSSICIYGTTSVSKAQEVTDKGAERLTEPETEEDSYELVS